MSLAEWRHLWHIWIIGRKDRGQQLKISSQIAERNRKASSPKVRLLTYYIFHLSPNGRKRSKNSFNPTINTRKLPYEKKFKSLLLYSKKIY